MNVVVRSSSIDDPISLNGLVIHAGDFGGELLYELRTRNRQELVKAIEDNLSQIANGKL
jgi:hypothetical protein